VKVALLGFGTVGSHVARILATDAKDLQLTHVFNRGVERKKVDWLPDVRWTDNADHVLSSDADIVVEVMGGREPAGTYVRRALESGKSVVTANKQLIANDGTALLELARERGVHLSYEASVAGGIPVVRALREGLSGDRLHRVSGVLNGTCNYILTRMGEAGATFESALAEAQALGFAEADPTDDVDGFDARAKLCILARVALGLDVSPGEVACRTIRDLRDVDFMYAQRLGCTIRQVSRVERLDDGSVVAWVQPAIVASGSPLARVTGSENVVLTSGVHGGETAFSGRGAGGGPTAVAVVSDLVAIARRGGQRNVSSPAVSRPSSVTAEFSAPHYLRFVVTDQPVIIARLATILATHRINIDAVFQAPGMSKDALPFVVTLEACDPAQVNAALAEMLRLDFNVAPPFWMPMLG
jgi:homoserine dehydrogenase